MQPSRIRLYAAGVLTLAAMPQAFAAGTLAGTDVSNFATVDFSVSSVNQPDVTSNTVTFETDRRINLTVAEVGAADTIVVPGSTDQVLSFTVTNSSNSTQDFRLAATNDTTGTTTAHGDTDSFDPSAFSVFVESGATAGFQPAQDTATFIDELAPDTTVTVYIVSDIANTQVNGDTAGLTLTAVAAQSTNGTGNYVTTAGTLAADAAETNTASLDDPTFVDTVFGDVAGDTDAAQDGRHSDDDEYEVVTASITVTKTSRVVSDPFNGTTNPKAIPGAVIEYCVQVSNTGSATADSVTTTDAVPANTTYSAGSIFAGGSVTGGVCDTGAGGGTAEDDDALGADETDPNGGSFAAGTVSTTIPSVPASTTATSRFRVTIQ